MAALFSMTRFSANGTVVGTTLLTASTTAKMLGVDDPLAALAQGGISVLLPGGKAGALRFNAHVAPPIPPSS